MSSLTAESLELAYAEVQARCFTYVDGTRSGPWIDHMDLALRKFDISHQFAIVGFGIGVAYGVNDASGHTPPERAAWSTLLVIVTKRAGPIELGQEPPGGFRRRTTRRGDFTRRK